MSPREQPPSWFVFLVNMTVACGVTAAITAAFDGPWWWPASAALMFLAAILTAAVVVGERRRRGGR